MHTGKPMTIKPDTSPLSTPASRETIALAEDLRQCIGSFVRNVRSEANTPTSAQNETLALIARDGLQSMAVLAQKRSVKHQSMRLVIAQLEKAGHITRQPNPDDARSHLIALTAAGENALTTARQARTDWIAAKIQTTLNTTERQSLRDAITILQKLGVPTDDH
ncbi:MarR family transcriptional regulator [Thalassospira marina]|uniref:MarR family transcriptional regulator n=2 Tax=Thalassospira marina TaxID=2048283 RepID=A0A2N3KXG6_9PROT|nr:MarR family transcriptional regulator [Thalassospira marina]